MDRRKFLKNLGILLAATQLPTRLLDGVAVPAKTVVINEWRHVTYALGFRVSQEMIDDDVYKQMMGSAEQIAARNAEFARLSVERVIELNKQRIDNILPDGEWRSIVDFDTQDRLFKKIYRPNRPKPYEEDTNC